MNLDINHKIIRSYATEENLDAALERAGLAERTEKDAHGHDVKLRYIKCRNREGRWTAVFLVSEFVNKCGGYVMIASDHGFMSV